MFLRHKFEKCFLALFLIIELVISPGQAAEPIQTGEGHFIPVVRPDEIPQHITTSPDKTKDSPLSPIPITISAQEKQLITERFKDLEEKGS
jgi:hypothetical protein